MAGTLNKKGKSPFPDSSQNPKSKCVRDFHSYTDNGFSLYPGDNERIVEGIIADKSLDEKIKNGTNCLTLS